MNKRFFLHHPTRTKFHFLQELFCIQCTIFQRLSDNHQRKTNGIFITHGCCCKTDIRDYTTITENQTLAQAYAFINKSTFADYCDLIKGPNRYFHHDRWQTKRARLSQKEILLCCYRYPSIYPTEIFRD